MALHATNIPLEERLSGLDGDVTEALRVALCKYEIKEAKFRHKEGYPISGAYSRGELTAAIITYFSSKGIPFGKGGSYNEAETTLNTSSANWEAFKPVERGMRVKDIPPDFVRKLDDWEKLYFFAGVDAVKDHPADFGSLDAYEIASYYIAAGMENMENSRNSIAGSVHRRKKHRGNREINYSKTWTAPWKDRISGWIADGLKSDARLRKRYTEINSHLQAIILEEAQAKSAIANPTPGLKDKKYRLLDEIGGDICTLLDGLNREALRYLQHFYTPQQIGEYKVLYPLPKNVNSRQT